MAARQPPAVQTDSDDEAPNEWLDSVDMPALRAIDPTLPRLAVAHWSLIRTYHRARADGFSEHNLRVAYPFEPRLKAFLERVFTDLVTLPATISAMPGLYLRLADGRTHFMFAEDNLEIRGEERYLATAADLRAYIASFPTMQEIIVDFHANVETSAKVLDISNIMFRVHEYSRLRKPWALAQLEKLRVPTRRRRRRRGV